VRKTHLTVLAIVVAALGAIWTLGDNLYLDVEASYQRMWCLEQPCQDVNKLVPRVLLTFNL